MPITCTVDYFCLCKRMSSPMRAFCLSWGTYPPYDHRDAFTPVEFSHSSNGICRSVAEHLGLSAWRVSFTDEENITELELVMTLFNNVGSTFDALHCLNHWGLCCILCKSSKEQFSCQWQARQLDKYREHCSHPLWEAEAFPVWMHIGWPQIEYQDFFLQLWEVICRSKAQKRVRGRKIHPLNKGRWNLWSGEAELQGHHVPERFS